MSTSAPQARRRRAAWAVLAPLLDEDALLDALRLQHQSMRGDSVADIIGFIDQVTGRHDIDAAQRKKLYEAYYKALRQPEDELPMDPWPLMQIGMPAVSVPPQRPAAAPVTAPAAPPPPAPVEVIAPVPAPQPAAATAAVAAAAALPAEQAVCAGLMREVMLQMQRHHASRLGDLGSCALSLLAGGGLPASVRTQVREAWTAPQQHSWVIEAGPAELAQVVHLGYVALCEALGPVDADQVLARAVRAAGQMPQARSFPPARLL